MVLGRGFRKGSMEIGKGQTGPGKMPAGMRSDLDPLFVDRWGRLVQLPASQEPSRVCEGKHRGRLGYQRPDAVKVDRVGTLDIAARKLEQRQMPRGVAVEMPRSVVIFQPCLYKTRTPRCVAQFEETMYALVRRMGVPRVAGERTLDQPGPKGDLACFDVGPTQIAEEPPIVTPIGRQFLQERQLHLVVIALPAEAEEPKDLERQRQGQRVARVFRSMSANERQRLGRGSFDSQRNHVDVSLLPDRDARPERLRPHHGLPRLRDSGLQLQQAGTGDVREREIGIGGESALQQLCGTSIRRQQQINRRHMIVERLGGGRGDRKIKAVRHSDQHHPDIRSNRQVPAQLILGATITLLIIGQEDVS